MCNLYHHSISAADMTLFAEAMGVPLSGTAGSNNYEPGYVGADADGPVLCMEDDSLTMRKRRWGFPSWKEGAKPITNIRNLESSWWWGANGEYITKPEYRCLIPFDRFAEWDADQKSNAWFNVDMPNAYFAGFWRPWRGERLKSIEGRKRRQREVDDWELFAFMTTEPNATVASVHPKAMPAIITSATDAKQWLLGGADSLNLQRPLSDGLTQRIDERAL